VVLGFELRALHFVRQVLYHFRHLQTFLLWLFGDLLYFFPRLAWTTVLLYTSCHSWNDRC
jgi:hypothetical protein